jgi:hypothetical protein
MAILTTSGPSPPPTRPLPIPRLNTEDRFWQRSDEVNGDMLTLRWRDYPRERKIVRHRQRLGLLYPGLKPTSDTAKANKAAAKDQKPTATAPSAGSQPLPRDWQQIDVGQLVLAKSEGPWSSWWEAVPVEKVGDGFKLRWRDGVNKSPCTRARLDLALICPDAT